MRKNANLKQYPYVFLIPALSIYFIFYLAPTLLGFGFSFTNWSAYSTELEFVGLTQFANLLEDPVIVKCLTNTLLYAVGTAILQNVVALFLAVLLDTKIRSSKLFRAIFFFPSILTPLIVGYLFQGIFQYDGIFNSFLGFFGFKDIGIQWLGDVRYSMIIVIGVAVWYGAGLHMTIYLASLQGIGEEVLEASKLDGASGWQTLFYVKLRLITAGFTVNIIYSIINALKVFGIIFVLTGGGPGRSTVVFNTYIFETFSKGMYGYASAIGVTSFLLVCVIAFPVMAILKGKGGH